MKNPTAEDFEHGVIERCYCCKRTVKCLHLDGTEVCAKCFPWWLASRKPNEVHHHAAPHVPMYDPPRPKERFPRRPIVGDLS